MCVPVYIYMALFHVQTTNGKCVRNVLGEADGAGGWERRSNTVWATELAALVLITVNQIAVS